MSSKSAILEYRRRLRTSTCRGLDSKKCTKMSGCKYAGKGKTRKYCRKSKNSRRSKLVRHTSKQSSSGSSGYATANSQ